MAIQWKVVWSDAIRAAKGSLGDGIAKADTYANQVAQSHRTAIESIARARLMKQIDQETFEFEMESEKELFSAELLTIQAIGKASAQGAANAFFNVISKAVSAGIGGLL